MLDPNPLQKPDIFMAQLPHIWSTSRKNETTTSVSNKTITELDPERFKEANTESKIIFWGDLEFALIIKSQRSSGFQHNNMTIAEVANKIHYKKTKRGWRKETLFPNLDYHHKHRTPKLDYPELDLFSLVQLLLSSNWLYSLSSKDIVVHEIILP